MNVGKSIEICLAMKSMKKMELAAHLDVTRHTVANLCKSKTCSGKMLLKLCKLFEMKVSEFIALGE
jgi:plasmid maintenance system antidote protein VapI